MINAQNIAGLYSQLKTNPAQALASRFNIPQNVNMSNPNDILQYLLNSGQVSQQQINSAMAMRNNPLVSQLMRH